MVTVLTHRIQIEKSEFLKEWKATVKFIITHGDEVRAESYTSYGKTKLQASVDAVDMAWWKGSRILEDMKFQNAGVN